MNYADLRVVCITTSAIRLAKAQVHFVAAGVGDVSFYGGIDAGQLGVATRLPYERDAPGSGYLMGPRPTGCWLSHRALWAALIMLGTAEGYLVIEDDAKFTGGWRTRMDRALVDAGDFDLLWVGSCCTGDKPRTHVAGEVWDLRYPLCTHGYVVRHRALERLCTTQDQARCYAPIDISLALHTMPSLKTYTVLPRLLDQFDTHIPV